MNFSQKGCVRIFRNKLLKVFQSCNHGFLNHDSFSSSNKVVFYRINLRLVIALNSQSNDWKILNLFVKIQDKIFSISFHEIVYISNVKFWTDVTLSKIFIENTPRLRADCFSKITKEILLIYSALWITFFEMLSFSIFMVEVSGYYWEDWRRRGWRFDPRWDFASDAKEMTTQKFSKW